MKEVKSWTKITDNEVQMVWKCPHCGVKAIVTPEMYADVGVPICYENTACNGTDMHYVQTEILK